MQNLHIPETKTPDEVILELVLVAVVLGALLVWFFGYFPGLIALSLVLASTTSTYTFGVPEFNASTVLNHWTGKQRVVFQGRSLKLPWEEPGTFVNLRVELTDVRNESYPAADALMSARYILTIRPNFSGNNPEASILRYASFEGKAIIMEGRAVFSGLFSDYFAEKPGKDTRNKEKINKELFDSEHPHPLVKRFQEEHGVVVVVKLEDVDFDKGTQEFRDLVSKAKSIGEAKKVLTDAGMSDEAAERFVKLMGIEGVKEWNLNITAPDLKNMTHFSAGGIVSPTSGGKKS